MLPNLDHHCVTSHRPHGVANYRPPYVTNYRTLCVTYYKWCYRPHVTDHNVLLIIDHHTIGMIHLPCVTNITLLVVSQSEKVLCKWCIHVSCAPYRKASVLGGSGVWGVAVWWWDVYEAGDEGVCVCVCVYSGCEWWNLCLMHVCVLCFHTRQRSTATHQHLWLHGLAATKHCACWQSSEQISIRWLVSVLAWMDVSKPRRGLAGVVCTRWAWCWVVMNSPPHALRVIWVWSWYYAFSPSYVVCFIPWQAKVIIVIQDIVLLMIDHCADTAFILCTHLTTTDHHGFE